MDTRFSEARLSLSPLDTIVLYTDGIIDACSMEGEPFGAERLDQALQGLEPALGAQKTIQAALKAVDVFSGSATQSDDQTLVAVKLSEDDDSAERKKRWQHTIT